jgi:hypothetical protein
MTLLYLPIDLPYTIDKEEIFSGFDPHSEFHVWNFEKLTEQVDGKYGRNYLKEKSKKRYPSLCKFIEQLPFDSLSNVKINIQTRATKAHIDFTEPENGAELFNNSKANEPCGYRIVIKGASDVLKIHRNDSIVTAIMPTNTHAYVINQSSGLHSVAEDPGRITVYTTGFINKEKHDILIEKSLKRFGNYAVYG